MVFYLEPKGENAQEFLAEHGEYIGMLGGEQSTITAKDISLEKIEAKLKERKCLICLVQNSTWWIGIIFNTADGAREVRQKHKGKTMLWFWLDMDKVEFCMSSMTLKTFKREMKKLLIEE